MNTAKVTFTKCVLSEQEIAREQNEAMGTVYFTVEHGHDRIEDSADFRQRVGSALETGLVDVMGPEETTILDQEDFARKAGEYIRNLLWTEDSSVGDAGAQGGMQTSRDNRRREQGFLFNKVVTTEVALKEEETESSS
ncbi:MAG: hypothetical protein ACLFTB_05650 [Desulfovibrionales bacterium]